MEKMKDLENPFEGWKRNIGDPETNEAKKLEQLVALIPFARNIAQYTGQSEAFRNLTKVLHIKKGSPDDISTKDLKFKDLEDILVQVIKIEQNTISQFHDKKVLDTIIAACDSYNERAATTFKLEQKILLSIGIRLKTEVKIIEKLDDDNFLEGVSKNKTKALIDEYIIRDSDNNEARAFV